MNIRVGWCFVVVAACGGDKDSMVDSGGAMVIASHARVLHGPNATGSTVARLGPVPAPVDGRWAITPDKAKLTLTNVTFIDQQGNPFDVELTACTPIYERTGASLSELLDCPFEAPFGSYSSMRIAASTTYEMLLDDATNGFFTNGTGVVTTSPGTASFSSFTVSGPGGMGTKLSFATFFAEPLLVDDTHPVDLRILVDMIHTVGVDVSGGAVSVDVSAPTLPAVMVPSVSGAGRSEFYSGTADPGNVMMGPLGSTGTWSGVRAFYASPPQPSYIFYPGPGPSEAYNVDPAKAPPNGTMFKAGGYLGIDGTNTMCWAMPANDYSYSAYSLLCKMPVVAAGASTTISCQDSSTAPLPISGDTYASGCPAITPTMTANVTLIAQ